VAELDWLTFDLFGGRVGEGFDLHLTDDVVIPLELAAATESSEPGGRGPDGQERLQFSLVFTGAGETPLQQGTYRLAHADLGELDLFLVPLGPESGQMRYEAAFA
jgi:hypothetical protein